MPCRLAHLAQEDSRLPPRQVSLGSLTRVVHELTVRLGRRWPTTVLSTRFPGDAAEERADGLRHLRFPRGADAVLLAGAYGLRNRIGRRLGLPDALFPASRLYHRRWVGRVARHLRGERYDLLHLHNVSQWIPPLRAALPSARLVLQMHCEWLVELPRAAVARRLAHADLILGVSGYVVQQIRAAFPDLAPRCRVLPNGVDPAAFPPRERVQAERAATIADLRARLRIRGPVVLFVGRLSSEKGAHTLLDALGPLRRRHPDATCVIVGPDWGPIRKVRPASDAIAALDRDYVEHLHRLAAPHADRVVFTGPVPNTELPLYHAIADVLAAPSLLEAFGIPPVEAAAAGLPVVAAATGGLVETVVPGRTGLLVPPGDPAALAAALAALLADPARARALGTAGRERVLADFTWDRVADTLAGFYDELLTRTPATRDSLSTHDRRRA
jgi:glycosyltransferase involved in cell wall biosynthesis